MKQGKLLVLAMITTLLLAAAAAADVQPQMEGEGFNTPQEAMAAYIHGLQNRDIDEMISAFAVETYAINYDLAKNVERVRSYIPSTGYLPQFSDFSVRLNIENQRKNITDIIRAHYLVLLGSPDLLGENPMMPTQLTEDYASAQELVDERFGVSDENILENIVFENEFYSPVIINSHYMMNQNLKNLKRQADMVNAQGICPLGASFTCNGKFYFLSMDALQYGTKWYLSSTSGNLAMLMGIPSMQRGLTPIETPE